MHNSLEILITLFILFLILFIIQILKALGKLFEDTYTQEELKEMFSAHNLSIYNREIIEKSNICGCFYCLRTFKPDEIQEEDWVDMKDDEIPRPDDTATCPYCGIDSVLGDAAGVNISSEFLGKMKRYYF